MKRTRLDRHVERRSVLAQAIAGIYAIAEREGRTHDWILLELKTRVWLSPAYASLPQYMRNELRAESHGHLANVQNRLVWKLGPESGPTRAAGDPWTDEMSELSREPGALHGAHFWPSTDRPFNTYKPINGPDTERILRDTFGDEWRALGVDDRALVILDCTEGEGISNFAEYQRCIGIGNLAAYASVLKAQRAAKG